MYNNPGGLKPNTQSVLKRNMQSARIDPLASSTLGMNKTRSIKVVLTSDDSSRQNAQFVVLEEILLVASENTNAPPPTSATVSSPLLIVRALPNAVTWDNLDEVKEQRKYEMSTWKMYDRITTSRMRKVHSTGGLPPKFPSLPEQQRRLNTIDELNRCHAVSTLDSLADEPFEMDLL
mmetsp:Transcript_7026/g.10592  ORF Transcript_7026/g.10592 Transcript_7026/m.10592 type:complete len:177 (-) Transcript_7026:117-647(-)